MIQFIIICTCFVLLLFVWRYAVLSNGPPVFKFCWPFVGHIFTLLRCNTHEKLLVLVKELAENSNETGGVTRLFLGHKVYYHITDPEDAIRITKLNTNKHYVYDFAKKWMGNGLLTGSGILWKIHKKLISPAFSLQVQLEFLNIINNQGRLFVKKIEAHVNNGPVDLSTEFRTMTLKNVFFTFLRLSAEKDDEFYKMYLKTVDEAMKIVVKRFQSVFYHWDFIYNLSSLRRKEDNALKIINELTDEIVKRRRELNKIEAHNNCGQKTTETRNKALLDLLLDLNNEGKISMDELKHEINTVMTAALDTTSWVLNYTLVLLGTHPDVQEKVFEEIQEVVGEEDNDVEKHHLTKLMYMEAVIKESMRLYPPVPTSIRTLEENITLKNYTLPTGSNCIISLYGVHRNPCWGPDTEVYRPERWLENNENVNYFAGFSFGRRSCIGKTYAMLSLKTILSHIIRRYKVAANANDLRLEFDFVMKPISGHFISLKLR